MNVVEFWKDSNTCNDPACSACKRMERLLEHLAPMIPSIETLDAAAAQEDDAALMAVLDSLQGEVIACLFAAAVMTLYAASTIAEQGRIVNRPLAGHLFTSSLLKAVKGAGLPIPVAVTTPPPAEMKAALEQLAGVPNVPIKH